MEAHAAAVNADVAAPASVTMGTNPRIKVIKLAERKRRAKARADKERDSASRPGQDKAPDAAATVNGWVDELRRQKHEGAGALSAFNDLFEDAT